MGSPIFFDYRANPNMIDLINQGGQAQAEYARRQAEMFAGAFQGVGQAVGGAIQQHQEQKQQSKNERALRDAIYSWDDNDPQGSAMRLVQVAGPKGLEWAKTFASLKKDVQSKDPKTNLQAAKAVIAVWDKDTPEGKAKGYPKLLQTLAPTGEFLGIDPAQVPPEYGPEAQSFIERFGVGADTFLGTKPEKVDAPKPGSFEAFAAARGATSPDAMLAARTDWESAGRAPVVPPKPEKTLKEKTDEAYALSAAHAAGTASVKPPKADTSDEIEGYLSALRRGDISMSDVKGKDYKAVLAAADAEGIDTRTKIQKGIDADAEAVLASIGQIEEQAKKAIDATTGVGAMIQGSTQRALNMVGMAKQTRLWDAQMSKLASVARQLGERGTLSDKDIDRVSDLLPGLTDPTDVRDKKLKDVREIIESGLRQKVSKRVKFSRDKEEDALVEEYANAGR